MKLEYQGHKYMTQISPKYDQLQLISQGKMQGKRNVGIRINQSYSVQDSDCRYKMEYEKEEEI